MTSFGGLWTQKKLEIIRAYLDAYTTVLKDQPFQLIYVDAFAGEGYWRPGSSYASEDYEDFTTLLHGSTAIALNVRDRPFDRFVFIENDKTRSDALKSLALQHSKRCIKVIPEDANVALPRFCDGMDRLDRAVVFLDPFATQVSWDTVAAIALTQKIDCWILFPLSAIARMMPTGSSPPLSLTSQPDRVFGGREHWQGVYREPAQLSFFKEKPGLERASGSAQIADRYQARLESEFAGLASTSRTLRNSKNSPMFELYFAAGSVKGAGIAVRIAKHILERL